MAEIDRMAAEGMRDISDEELSDSDMADEGLLVRRFKSVLKHLIDADQYFMA